MENEMLQYMITQGAFAVLFVYMLFYVLKENAKRETKYQETVSALTDRLGIVKETKEDIFKIKNDVKEIKSDVIEIKSEVKSIKREV